MSEERATPAPLGSGGSTFPSQDRIVTRSRGNDFGAFEVGQTFAHHWGRTLTEADNVLFATMTLHFNPVYFNVETARARGFRATPINPLLVMGIAIGLSVEDMSERSEAFLGIDDVRFEAHVYPGDTIDALSTVVEKRVSASKPDLGVVAWTTEVRNQHHELTAAFRRANLFQLNADVKEHAS